jgi:pimeloyl-ACP methyl ester carboxylesterase
MRVRSDRDVSRLIPRVSAGFRLVDVLVSVVSPPPVVVVDVSVVVSFVVELSPQAIKLKTTAAVASIFFIDVILIKEQIQFSCHSPTAHYLHFMTPLILLHGAIGAASQFEPLRKQLGEQHDVYAINFSGHGGEMIEPDKFSIKHFAEQVASFIHNLHIQPVNIFGYSMGGYVAMYMARHLNVDIGKIITLGTKFHWDEAVAAKEIKMLQPDVIEQKIPVFAQQLNQRHHPQSWKEVLQHTANMLQQMGRDNPLQPDDYMNITTPSLIMIGDKDKMVTLEETVNTYQKLPNGQLAVLPATPHAIEQVDASLIAFYINRFLYSSGR